MREMGMDMRERLARAIGETKCNGTSLHQMTRLAAHAAGVRWEEDKFSASMLTIADAVLAALREPTEEMLDAAHEPARHAVSAFGKTGAFVSSAFSGPIWQAMLNAAAK